MVDGLAGLTLKLQFGTGDSGTGIGTAGAGILPAVWVLLSHRYRSVGPVGTRLLSNPTVKLHICIHILRYHRTFDKSEILPETNVKIFVKIVLNV